MLNLNTETLQKYADNSLVRAVKMECGIPVRRDVYSARNSARCYRDSIARRIAMLYSDPANDTDHDYRHNRTAAMACLATAEEAVRRWNALVDAHEAKHGAAV